MLKASELTLRESVDQVDMQELIAVITANQCSIPDKRGDLFEGELVRLLDEDEYSESYPSRKREMCTHSLRTVEA